MEEENIIMYFTFGHCTLFLEHGHALRDLFLHLKLDYIKHITKIWIALKKLMIENEPALIEDIVTNLFAVFIISRSFIKAVLDIHF